MRGGKSKYQFIAMEIVDVILSCPLFPRLHPSIYLEYVEKFIPSQIAYCFEVNGEILEYISNASRNGKMLAEIESKKINQPIIEKKYYKLDYDTIASLKYRFGTICSVCGKKHFSQNDFHVLNYEIGHEVNNFIRDYRLKKLPWGLCNFIPCEACCFKIKNELWGSKQRKFTLEHPEIAAFNFLKRQLTT